jgi:23S rRNA G2069 N7-methylase RlmK/C1962 C5-methylase RlmI
LEAAQRTQESEEQARHLERQAQEVTPRRVEELVREEKKKKPRGIRGHGIESAFLAAGEHDDLKATVTVYRPK